MKKIFKCKQSINFKFSTPFNWKQFDQEKKIESNWIDLTAQINKVCLNL